MRRCPWAAAAVVALWLLSCREHDVGVGGNTELEQRVEHDLREEGFTCVLAAADDGIVTLTGFVPTEDDRCRAREVANRRAQVSLIEDRILVRAPARAAFAPR